MWRQDSHNLLRYILNSQHDKKNTFTQETIDMDTSTHIQEERQIQIQWPGGKRPQDLRTWIISARRVHHIKKVQKADQRLRHR